MNESLDTLTVLLDLYVPEYLRQITYVPWVFSLIGSALIGLSGILPLIIIPSVEAGKDIKNRKLLTYPSSTNSVLVTHLKLRLLLYHRPDSYRSLTTKIIFIYT